VLLTIPFLFNHLVQGEPSAAAGGHGDVSFADACAHGTQLEDPRRVAAARIVAFAHARYSMRLAAFHRSFDVDAQQQQQQQQLLEQQRLQQQQQGRQGMTQTVTGLAAAAAQASGAAQAKALPLSNRYGLLPVQEEATGTSSDGQQPQQQAVAPGPGCVAGEGAARRGSRLRDEDYMAAAVRFDATPPRKHRAVCQDVAATPSPGQPLATGDPDLRQFIKDLTEAAGLSKPLNPRKKVCQQAGVAVGASSCPDEHAAVGGGRAGSVDVVGGSRGCERGSPEPAMPQAVPEGLQGHVVAGPGVGPGRSPAFHISFHGKSCSAEEVLIRKIQEMLGMDHPARDASEWDALATVYGSATGIAAQGSTHYSYFVRMRIGLRKWSNQTREKLHKHRVSMLLQIDLGGVNVSDVLGGLLVLAGDVLDAIVIFLSLLDSRGREAAITGTRLLPSDCC